MSSNFPRSRQSALAAAIDGAQTILVIRGVEKSYEDGRICALRGVDLEVHAGEFLAITGASGSGKSTLLHLIGGLDTPSAGEILFRGKRLGNDPGAMHLDEYRSRSIGFVFQAFYLLPMLTALENVQVPVLGRRDRNWTSAARALLAEVGLAGRIDQLPAKLSAGERQRVAIARSLIHDPEMLLADEPTGNLDSVNSQKIMDLLSTIQQRRNMTLIVVTHDAGIASAAHRHIAMRDGRIVA